MIVLYPGKNGKPLWMGLKKYPCNGKVRITDGLIISKYHITLISLNIYLFLGSFINFEKKCIIYRCVTDMI